MIFQEMSITDRLNLILNDPEKAPMSIAQIVTEEIREFKQSPEYARLLEAEQYYRNRSDVQNKTVEIAKRSNTKIEHPILKKLVDQKVKYLLAKPWTVKTENKKYAEALNSVFDKNFRRKIKIVGRDAVKSGIIWMIPYMNEQGVLSWLRVPATELVPLWKDSEETEMAAFIHLYEQTVYIGTRKHTVTHAEFWFDGGVKYFRSDDSTGTAGNFVVDKEYGEESNDYCLPHLTINGKPYNWETVPVVWVKYNDEKLPLFYYLKDLIDDINWQKSITADALRDIATFIYILRNYGGADLKEFVSDLQNALAVKVDGDGGIDKLQADLNIDAVMKHLDDNRRNLYDYANAVDTKDPDLGNASGTAIHFRYTDLDNDCSDLADEFQACFESMKLFIDAYLQIKGVGDFRKDTFEIVFNADMPINEGDVITNIKNSTDLSLRTRLENHPWIKDADEELARIEKEKQQALETFGEGLFDDALKITPKAQDGVSDGDTE